MVFRNEQMKEVVFPVNAKAPEEDDKKEAIKIRASIEKGATQHKIPIWWFILQLILESTQARQRCSEQRRVPPRLSLTGVL